jgi:LysM repeat protein
MQVKAGSATALQDTLVSGDVCVYHVITSRDTLSSLASLYNTPLTLLQLWNNDLIQSPRTTTTTTTTTSLNKYDRILLGEGTVR